MKPTYDELVEALEDMTAEVEQMLREDGGCDHDVGICWCDTIERARFARSVLSRIPGGAPQEGESRG